MVTGKITLHNEAVPKASLLAGIVARLKVSMYLRSPLRVETLSFAEAADFNPQD
jgi:hypothetical protein